MLSGRIKETAAMATSSALLEADDDSEIVSTSPGNAGPPIDAAHVPKKLWRHSSMDVCANLEAKNESKVLVLYTGKWRPSYYKIKRDLIVMFFYYFCLEILYRRNDRHDEKREWR